MKKIIASAVGLMIGGGLLVTNVQAEVENQFGGYWRTRFSVADNVANKPDSSFARVDTRTRLYYTAKFTDDFKFVNKLEWNTSWGDTNGGDLGTDGDTLKFKHSYVDYTMGSLRTQVGLQAAWYGRGILFDDDFAGITLTPTFGNVKLPIIWMNLIYEISGNDNDYNVFMVAPEFKVSDAMTVTPYVMYAKADGDQDEEYWYIGGDIDAKLSAVSVYGTGIYQGGDVMDVDKSAWAFLVGADAGIAHGQFLYATGNDLGDTDNDAYVSVSPWYTTSEIMGEGMFSAGAAPGVTGWDPSNKMFIGGGVTIKPAEKWTLTGDVWYGMTAEDDAFGNDAIGLEFDLLATYNLIDRMNLDMVAAYLFADDVVEAAAGNDDDVWELGARLSFSF